MPIRFQGGVRPTPPPSGPPLCWRTPPVSARASALAAPSALAATRVFPLLMGASDFRLACSLHPVAQPHGSSPGPVARPSLTAPLPAVVFCIWLQLLDWAPPPSRDPLAPSATPPGPRLPPRSTLRLLSHCLRPSAARAAVRPPPPSARRAAFRTGICRLEVAGPLLLWAVPRPAYSRSPVPRDLDHSQSRAFFSRFSDDPTG